MQKLEYTIDQKEFDTLILGTGMTEALFAASLAKIDRQKILIVDADQGYSSSQKTFNFRELMNDMEEKNKNKNKCLSQQFKKDFFETLELSEGIKANNLKFIDEVVNQTTLYKQFNIDLQPKLLFSTSLTVDCMRQGNMDQYMDFRAVDAIYFFETSSKRLIQTPCSKSDIFKSKEFSLMEKKQLFQFLHKCVTLYNRTFDQKVNQNSIEEFDKEFEVDDETMKLYNKLSDQPCIEFLRETISSKKVQDVFLYNLCSFEYNPNEPIPLTLQKSYTTKSFLHRLNKYIKSCGVHTALPYLYTNYGTGDIPQGFARISAVFGSTYCLHKNLDIQIIKKDEEKGLFLIKSNLQKQSDEIAAENQQDDESVKYIYPSSDVSKDKLSSENQQEIQVENNNIDSQEQQIGNEVNLQEQNKKLDLEDKKQEEETITVDYSIQDIKEEKQKEEINNLPILEDNYISVKNIIAGPEYKQKVKELLGLKQEEVKESMNLLRVTIISRKSQKQNECEQEVEDLEEEEKAKRENRFTCPILYSIPPNELLGFKQPFSILHLDHGSQSAPTSHQVFYCKKILENKENYMEEVQKIIDFVENIHQYLKNLPFQYTADYVWAYAQNKNDQGLFEQISDDAKSFQISFIGQDYFEIDMDKNFEEFRDTISTISSQINNQSENYFQTIQELNGEVDFYQNKIQEDDEEYLGIDKLINKFQQLKQNDNQQQNVDENKNSGEQVNQIQDVNSNSLDNQQTQKEGFDTDIQQF